MASDDGPAAHQPRSSTEAMIAQEAQADRLTRDAVAAYYSSGLSLRDVESVRTLKLLRAAAKSIGDRALASRVNAEVARRRQGCRPNR